MLLLLLLLFVGVVGVMGVMGCGDISWNEDRIMAGWTGLLWGGTSLGLLSDPKEEELECLRGVGFLAVTVSGLKISTSIFSPTGSAGKKNCLRKLPPEKNLSYRIFLFSLTESNLFPESCVVMGSLEFYQLEFKEQLYQPCTTFVSLFTRTVDWVDSSSKLLWFSTVYRM